MKAVDSHVAVITRLALVWFDHPRWATSQPVGLPSPRPARMSTISGTRPQPSAIWRISHPQSGSSGTRHTAGKSRGAQVERLRLRLGAEGDRLHQLATMIRLRGESVRGWLPDVNDERVEKFAAERTHVDELRRKFLAEALKLTEARLHRPSAATSSDKTSEAVELGS